MRITINKQISKMTFQSIKIGDMFFYDDRLYVKTISLQGYNSNCIGSGLPNWFGSDVEVRPVVAITVEVE